jgi:hypothetical protein
MSLRVVSVRTHASRVHSTPLFIIGGPPCGGRIRARRVFGERRNVDNSFREVVRNRAGQIRSAMIPHSTQGDGRVK